MQVERQLGRRMRQGTAIRSSAHRGKTARVLLVDDNPDDRTLVMIELRRLFPNLQFIEVSNQQKLDAAFSEGGIDLLITDYQLYWSDGLRILGQLLERAPGVPAIMFTGTGNEEVAVEAMKAGVQDYILKTPKHFDRLRASVRMALEVGRHRAAVAEAEARCRNLFETVPVGLFRCTPNGKILDANPAFAAIAGITNREKIIGTNFNELQPRASDFSRWRDMLERDGAVAFIEAEFKQPAGSRRCVEIHAKAVRDPQTGMPCYEGSVEDITNRKESEREREKLISELKEALGKVKSLTGLLPICASCKKIRDDRGTWNVLETYIEDHSHAHFTHGFCPDCAQRLYPEVFVDTPKF